MRRRTAAIALLAAAVALGAGCVERRIAIRSDPPGAPVWVDEQYADLTPVDYAFAHYGWRRIRIGPVRGSDGKLQYLEKQVEVDVPAPWYQTFPIDFFFEVLYPGRITDEHVLPVFVLDSAADVPAITTGDAVEKLREQAADFRESALYGVPEAPPAP